MEKLIILCEPKQGIVNAAFERTIEKRKKEAICTINLITQYSWERH